MSPASDGLVDENARRRLDSVSKNGSTPASTLKATTTARPGRCPTLAARPRIRVRGRRRMISGTRFRWSIIIMPPPSLSNSLSHSRPTASLRKKSNNRSTKLRIGGKDERDKEGLSNEERHDTEKAYHTNPLFPSPPPLLATSRRSKLCHPHFRTTLHVPELHLHLEGIRHPQILIHRKRTSPSLHHFCQHQPSPRQMG